MSLLAMATFAALMLLLAVSPGPGVLATMARAFASGLKASLSLIAGIVAGDLLFLVFAVYGLSMLATQAAELFLVVKYLGGAYLLWLGIGLWRASFLPIQDGLLPTGANHATGFASGLLITLANPKVVLFYVGILPTFFDLAEFRTQDILVLSGIVIAVLATVLLGYAWFASLARERLSRSRITHRWLQRLAGTAMGSAGAWLLARN